MTPSYAGTAGFAALLTLAACMSAGRPPASEPRLASGKSRIELSVGPCFGFCPVYDTFVAEDGSVQYVGKRHTAVLGERSRRAGSEAYRELARDLLPFHPADGQEMVVECTAAVSDTSMLIVTWTDAAGGTTVAKVQAGCPGGPGQTLGKLLNEVPRRLGIEDWTTQTTREGTSRG